MGVQWVEGWRWVWGECGVGGGLEVYGECEVGGRLEMSVGWVEDWR